jgi:hypothetical protein
MCCAAAASWHACSRQADRLALLGEMNLDSDDSSARAVLPGGHGGRRDALLYRDCRHIGSGCSAASR